MKWDGSDVREVDTASLANGDLAQPLLAWSGAYMNTRTWVGVPAAGPALLDLHIVTEGHFPAPIPMTHVRVMMQIDPENRTAAHGVISGIVAVGDAQAWFEQIAGWGSNTFCLPSAVDAFVTVIAEYADITLDGANTEGVPCEGISVGMGFDATAVTLGNVGDAAPPAAPDTCPDGGVQGRP